MDKNEKKKRSFMEKILFAPKIKIIAANKRAIRKVLIITLIQFSPVLFTFKYENLCSHEKTIFQTFIIKYCKKS